MTHADPGTSKFVGRMVFLSGGVNFDGYILLLELGKRVKPEVT